jgi:Protein of unknown function (DUF3300)
MLSKLRSIITCLVIGLMVLQGPSPLLWAKAATPTPEELDQLLAPVALYPDALLSQITMASTAPQEILDVHAWLQANPGLTGAALTDAAEKQGFNPAFIALVNFPTVVAMMADHIDDYAAIGQAFSADQEAVTASIQRLRAQAYDSGALRTNEQQKVELQQATGQTVYVIQPASPTVVYVPQYDPTVVYVRPAPSAVVAGPMITFGIGIGIGALIVDNRPWGWGGWGWNWGARRAYYNHGYWNGWGNPYPPPHPWYRPRPIVWANRPGYRGNWGYRPPHYRPPSHPAPRPGRPGNPPERPYPRKPMPGRPGTPGKPVSPVTPGTPTPGKPSIPSPRKPIPDRPSGRPSKPETPNSPDQNRPEADQPPTPGGTKPTRPNRPSGERTKPGKPQQPGSNQPRLNRPNSNQSRPGPATPGSHQPNRPNPPSAQPAKRDTSPQPNSDQPKAGPPTTPGQGNVVHRGRPNRQQG